MKDQPQPIYPQFERMLPRSERERALRQRAHVFWLYGLSGSGKSTLAYAFERKLFGRGHYAQVLDGDNIRSGLNSDLGFSDADRHENIRRIAEVAKLFLNSGQIVVVSFITPRVALRELARAIIGAADFSEIHVHASYDTCAARDPKGLYKKVRAGEVGQFTGKDSAFEAGERPQLMLDTEADDLEACLAELWKYASPLIVPR